MKAPSPAFSLYPKDILADALCAAMTHAAFGMYVRLLCHCWLEGSVPSDHVKLQRLMKVSAKTFKKEWPSIEACFTQRGDRLVQLRGSADLGQKDEPVAGLALGSFQDVGRIATNDSYGSHRLPPLPEPDEATKAHVSRMLEDLWRSEG